MDQLVGENHGSLKVLVKTNEKNRITDLDAQRKLKAKSMVYETQMCCLHQFCYSPKLLLPWLR